MERFTKGLLAIVLPVALIAAASGASAQLNSCGYHPVLNPVDPTTVNPAEWHPQHYPVGPPSQATQNAEQTETYITTPPSFFDDAIDPFSTAQPSNLLPNVYENAKDCAGNEIPNTLPSTPENPYNLHPDPVVTDIDPTSPTDDLKEIFAYLNAAAETESFLARQRLLYNEVALTGSGAGGIVRLDMAKIRMALDILEGNPIAGRAYSGMPLLHYNGPNKIKVVDPQTRNVTVHQVWYDTHIESDAMFIDPSAVENETWTITYVIDVLNRGHEDFAPMGMFFDNPDLRDGDHIPNVAMDQTFFPMDEGKRYVIEMAMPPAKFWKLTYHWGWRFHPPRVQVTENALQAPMGITLPDWERLVFGDDPMASEDAKLAAIDMIGDLAPAKRMWNVFRAIRDHGRSITKKKLQRLVREAERAFMQWQDRAQLPDGVAEDSDADVTLLYVNNTLYGHVKGFTRRAQMRVDKWRTRGTTLGIRIYNGDYYPHAYVAVDFGGRRGWENTFQNTIPIGGQGPWFTFGRIHFAVVTPFPVMVPAAERPVTSTGRRLGMPDPDSDATLVGLQRSARRGSFTPLGLGRPRFRNADVTVDGVGTHKVEITFNYEPSRRLRLYQFDPLHHDVAVWSFH